MSTISKQFLFVFECAHQKFSQSDQVIVMMLEKGVSVIQSLGVKWSMSGSEIRVTLTRTENPGINLTRQMFRKTFPSLTNITMRINDITLKKNIKLNIVIIANVFPKQLNLTSFGKIRLKYFYF